MSKASNVPDKPAPHRGRDRVVMAHKHDRIKIADRKSRKAKKVTNS